MNRKLTQRLRVRELSQSDESQSGHGGRGDMADLFGIENLSLESNNNTTGNGNGRMTKSATRKIRQVKDLKDDDLRLILSPVFNLLTDPKDLASFRLVNKLWCEMATARFRLIHHPVRVSNESEMTHFDSLMATTNHFPFNRFKLVLEDIPKYRLMHFARKYEPNIKLLQIEPFVNAKSYAEANAQPQQQLLFKIKDMLQNLVGIEELDIQFPTLSRFDYSALEYEEKSPFRLEKLKSFSIRFVSNGFGSFTAEFAIAVIRSAGGLKKIRMNLPEPSNGRTESAQLEEFLMAASHVPSIGIKLNLRTNADDLLRTIQNIVKQELNTHIRQLTLAFGPQRYYMDGVVKALKAQSETLRSLTIYKYGGQEQTQLLRLPTMPRLEALHLDTDRIPFAPLRLNQFPILKCLSLRLLYGNEPFILNSEMCQDSVTELTLVCKDVSIKRFRQQPEHFMLPGLKTLNLVNPPPDYIPFFCQYYTGIENLCVVLHGTDPTYPVHSLLQQLNGQASETLDNAVDNLLDLDRLYLFLKIDQETAKFLAGITGLVELVVDDSEVPPKLIKDMRNEHGIYISWKPEMTALPTRLLKQCGVNLQYN